MATLKAPKTSSPITFSTWLDLHVSALWALVALEIGALVGLRRYFRRHHGG